MRHHVTTKVGGERTRERAGSEVGILHLLPFITRK